MHGQGTVYIKKEDFLHSMPPMLKVDCYGEGSGLGAPCQTDAKQEKSPRSAGFAIAYRRTVPFFRMMLANSEVSLVATMA